MKKHHYFERKRTKMILASSLAAVAIAGFAGCAEQGTVPTSQMDTKESARHEETFFSQTQIPSSTTSLETTCAETTAATSAEIPQTTQAAQTEPVPDSVLHMERTEDTEVLPYETVYEYSDRYYAGVRRVK